MLLLGCSSNSTLLQNEYVKDFLLENGIEKTKITKICNLNNIQELYDIESLLSVKISDEEFEKYVDDLLLIHEELVEVNDRNIVQTGDAVFVSYIVYYDDKIVANAESDCLLVGSGNYFEDFEDAVVGAEVGKPFVCELKSPVDTADYKKGDILKYNITVESINYFVTYTTSDQYILEYYGFTNEKDFLEDCKRRLLQQKKIEVKKQTDIDFLNALVNQCKFQINKNEIAVYSQKIVQEHKDLAYISAMTFDEYIVQKFKMTEEEFYDFCYDEGVEEIKRYLFVGAYTSKTSLDNQNFAEFCSMNGYDCNDDTIVAKYAFFEEKCVNELSQTNLYVYSVGYDVPFVEGKNYIVQVYDSSNVYGINYYRDFQSATSEELQQKIITGVKNLVFGETTYICANNLYDTVIAFKAKDENVIKIMVDTRNEFVSMHHYDSSDGTPYIVVTQLTNELKDLIDIIKRG